MVTFNTDNMVTQYFPFPKTIMDYIFNNVQPQHLIKLYPCCKFFYAKYRRNIIRHLGIIDDDDEDNEEIFDSDETIICASNPALLKLKDFWITDSLTYYSETHGRALPVFTHCTIKTLELSLNILWKEFIMLTEAGTVEELKIEGIFGEIPLTFASVEDIIARIPNAISIEIGISNITDKTMKALAEMNHKGKIWRFILNGIWNYPLTSIKYLVTFLFKSCKKHCIFRFGCEILQLVEGMEEDEEIREPVARLKELEKEFNFLVTEFVKTLKKRNVDVVKVLSLYDF